MNIHDPKYQAEIAKNWTYYKDKITLPKLVLEEVEKVVKLYNNMFLTAQETTNQIFDILNKYFPEKETKIKASYSKSLLRLVSNALNKNRDAIISNHNKITHKEVGVEVIIFLEDPNIAKIIPIPIERLVYLDESLIKYLPRIIYLKIW